LSYPEKDAKNLPTLFMGPKMMAGAEVKGRKNKKRDKKKEKRKNSTTPQKVKLFFVSEKLPLFSFLSFFAAAADDALKIDVWLWRKGRG
jgi:hypothetical protein